MWANGPFPAAMHDITIMYGGRVIDRKHKWLESSLYHHISDDKIVIEDSSYVGESEKVSTTLGGHTPEMKEFFARCKSRQESLFWRMKPFNILGSA